MKQLYNFITETGMKDLLQITISAVFMLVFFYFLFVFTCAIDDQCAAIYMEVADDNS